MKYTNLNKFIAFFATIVLAAGFAMPASADMTTSGYYDQFGVWHVYQTYAPPTNYYGTNYQYGANNYYPNGYPQSGQSASYNTYTLRPVTCASNELYRASDNICLPPARSNTVAITGTGYNATKSSAAGSAASTDTSDTSKDTYQASAISSIFGKKKTSDKLAISDVVITSGPKNIYEDKSDVNCDVLVSWKTSVASAGQVVYGPTSQPNIETFNYPSVAPEGNSYQTAHSVKLGCLENMTYSMRVVAYSGGANPQRVVSDEQTIFPIKIQTDIPSVTPSAEAVQAAGASAVGTLGSILMSPITFIILIVAILFFVVRWMLKKKGSAGGHGAPAHAAEPTLVIPHH